MLARIRRTAAVLAVVLAAYLTYSLLAVPFIEPTVKLSKKNRRPFPVGESRARKLEQLFPADAWELGRCKVLETDQGTLLFEDYERVSDDKLGTKEQRSAMAPAGAGIDTAPVIEKLRLTKCTVVAYMDSATNSGATNNPGEQRPIIIRAQQGATLHFDEKLDIVRGQFGSLLGGQLNGEVTIQSPPSVPGGNDGLDLVTRNVQIGRQKIWTPHEVRFRYGGNRGSGSGLTILLANIAKGGDDNMGLGVSGIRSLELDHLDRMELLLQNQGLFGSTGPSVAAKPVPKTASPSPVIVECAGPIRFDIDRQLVSLERDVRLSRLQPERGADQLRCERLEIHFTTNARSSKSAKSNKANPHDDAKSLVPTRVVATGSPVTVQAGAFGMAAQAERLEYDCQLQRVWLHDSDKVLMNDPHRRMEAKELRYTLGENNRLGELWAQGPGVVRGAVGDDLRQFEVKWLDKVHLQRIDGEPVLSFNDKAELKVVDVGGFVGDTVHLYLREKPRVDKPGAVETTVDRLHAIGHVEVDSPNCHATLREAKVWFKDGSTGVDAQQSEQLADPSLFAAPSATGQATSKFKLRAQTVEAVVLMGKRAAVDLLIVRGDLELQELAAAAALPLTIRGSHFELQRGASAHPSAALLGSPAEIRARGMAARGPKLHLYPADNLVEIVGAGDLKPTGETPLDPSQRRLPMQIQWGGRMQFDGAVARFEKSVVVQGAQRSDDGNLMNFIATGDAVSAELTQPIEFKNPSASTVGMKEVAFDGWGFLQADVVDAANERKMFQQMQVLGLSVNQVSGEIRGSGPGWLRGVHRNGEVAGFVPAVGAPADTKSPLVFLRVDFEREIAGNLHQQRIDFLNGTRTLYGPVNSWDEALDHEQAVLPESAIRMTCDRLTVAQFGEGKGDAIELEAVGNTHIRGAKFTATGGRASYVRHKDQFVLEGDGRNDARIEMFDEKGGRPSQFVAGKIMYWPRTGECRVDDFQQTELYDIGNLRGREAPQINRR